MKPETREAYLRRMMRALICQQVEVRVVSLGGRMVARRWYDRQQFIDAHGWMAAWSSGAERDARGERHHVYMIPHGHLSWVLVDDLSEGMLELMRDDGVHPTVVIRTNPHTPDNLQAWVCVGREEPRDVHLAACRLLANRYGADIGAAKPEQMGRVPCMYNAKPQHWIHGAPPPLVKLWFADSKGVRIARSVRDEAREIAATERERRAMAGEKLRELARGSAEIPADMLDPLDIVQDGRVVATMSPLSDDPAALWHDWPVRPVSTTRGDMNRSATDTRKAKSMLLSGVPSALVYAALLTGSAKARQRAGEAGGEAAQGYADSVMGSATREAEARDG